MTGSSAPVRLEPRYELRFAGLFNRGRGYAFPCDAQGRVDIDQLTDRARINYFCARAAVGTELSAPIVSAVPDQPVDDAVQIHLPRTT